MQRWTDADRDRIFDLRKAGKSFTEIADEYKVSTGAVRSQYWEVAGTGGRLEHAKTSGNTRYSKAAAADDSAKIKRLEEYVEKLERDLHIARAPRINLKAIGNKKQPKGTFIRVIIPDSHGAKISRPAARAFLNDLRDLNPSEIVMLGDHIDCGGFMAQHHTMGFVAETDYTFEEDVAAANGFLDEIQTLAPKAKIHFLAGNHEDRIEKWIVTMTLRNPKDSAFLKKRLSPDILLSLATRKINYYERSIVYQNLGIPGTIKLGSCCFTHGSRTGCHSAAAMLKDFGGNVVFGHTHTIDMYSMRTVNSGLIASWCPGTLSEIQPLWRHTQITRWGHGYGIQLVQADGSFLHINVPIHDGASHLTTLTDNVKLKPRK